MGLVQLKHKKTTWKDLSINSYSDYLKSIHWGKLKKRYITTNASCYVCGKRYSLLLHHVSYDRLGKEKIGRDLVIVCFKCHQKIHYWFWIFKVPLKKQNLLVSMYYRKMITKTFRAIKISTSWVVKWASKGCKLLTKLWS